MCTMQQIVVLVLHVVVVVARVAKSLGKWEKLVVIEVRNMQLRVYDHEFLVRPRAWRVSREKHACYS